MTANSSDESNAGDAGVSWTSLRARIAAYASHIARTPEQASEHARKMAEDRWGSHRTGSVEGSGSPVSSRGSAPSFEEIQSWLGRVGETFPDDYVPTDRVRMRRAILLARQQIARDELAAMKADEAVGND